MDRDEAYLTILRSSIQEVLDRLRCRVWSAGELLTYLQAERAKQLESPSSTIEPESTIEPDLTDENSAPDAV